jgi:dTDP-4-dehydrorhamnose reductase
MKPYDCHVTVNALVKKPSLHGNLMHAWDMTFVQEYLEQLQQALECNNPEHWFRALSSRNIPIVALSTDHVYEGDNAIYKAPFGEAHSTFLHFFKTCNGKETDFYTDECQTVVSIHDVVDILVYICKHGIASSGIYNMGGRDRVLRYDMAHALFDHLRYDTRYLVAKMKALLPVMGIASPLDPWIFPWTAPSCHS